MTTHFHQTVTGCLQAVQDIAARTEILGVPDSDGTKVADAKAFVRGMREIASVLDHMLNGLAIEADQHINAMSSSDRKACVSLVSDSIDWITAPFEKFAAEHQPPRKRAA